MQGIISGDTPAPLTTSKMGNLQAAVGANAPSGFKVRKLLMILDL